MRRPESVYIAGKMKGLPDNGAAAFAAAEQELQKLGLIVLNPAVFPNGLPGNRYMPMCLSMVETASALILLEGWEDSPGARLEKAYAEYQGKPVYELREYIAMEVDKHVAI